MQKDQARAIGLEIEGLNEVPDLDIYISLIVSILGIGNISYTV